MDDPSMPSGTVTFLFTDVERSTALWDRFPDGMGDALGLHDRVLPEVFESHGGFVFATGGDGLSPSPPKHEARPPEPNRFLNALALAFTGVVILTFIGVLDTDDLPGHSLLEFLDD